MIFDSLDVSYGETWGLTLGAAHPQPISRASAARRHAAGYGYAVLLAAQGQPLAMVEYYQHEGHQWWKVYLFDDRSYRTQLIGLESHSNGMLRVYQKIRWQYSSERQYFSREWDVYETTTVSADGQVEIRSEFDGSDKALYLRRVARNSGQSTVEPENSTVQLFSAPVEDFLCPAPQFGDWQVFVRFLAQYGHEPAAAVTLNEASPEDSRGPLRANGIEQMFVPGGRDTPHGPAVVELIDAGLLQVPSGRLVAMDPGWPDRVSATIPVPAGEYPVTVSLMRFADTMYPPRVAAARVTLLDAPPIGWEMSLRPDEDHHGLGDGEFYGVGVDTGIAAFLDLTRTVDEDEFNDELVVPLDSSFTVELAGAASAPNLIGFRAGAPEGGTFPVWIGRTEDEQVSCVVIDFQLYPPLRQSD
ncbi:DUF4241 domain-containing protein [Nocardia sp. NPDC051756]|uniref:DUF4241 domain-containing protein n=1 Tax=Nocardia sp. NPDC051756 TaxID=3154751 RepID=UPI0034179DE2